MPHLSYCPEPDIHNNNKTKVELDLSNHATESEVKKATGSDALKFAKKADLASLKSE